MTELRATAIAIAGLSALVGGVAGALVTATLLRGSSSPTDVRVRPEPPAEAPQPRPAPTDERIASLERSLRALQLEHSVTRATPPIGSAPRDPDAPPPVADVAPIVDNPVFEAAVRDVMERAEQERDLERETQRTEWRKRTAEEWGKNLGEKLRLTEAQQAKVTEIAQTFLDRLRDLRQTDAGAPPSRQERREQAAALRKAAEAELAKILDHSQLTTYGELDEGDKIGSPRGLRNAQRGP